MVTPITMHPALLGRFDRDGGFGGGSRGGSSNNRSEGSDQKGQTDSQGNYRNDNVWRSASANRPQSSGGAGGERSEGGFQKPWEKREGGFGGGDRRGGSSFGGGGDRREGGFQKPWERREGGSGGGERREGGFGGGDRREGGFQKPWERREGGAGGGERREGGFGGGDRREGGFSKPWERREGGAGGGDRREGGFGGGDRREGGFSKPWEKREGGFGGGERRGGSFGGGGDRREGGFGGDRRGGSFGGGGDRREGGFSKPWEKREGGFGGGERREGGFGGGDRRESGFRKTWENKAPASGTSDTAAKPQASHIPAIPVGELLFGRQPVRELLRAQRRVVKELMLTDGIKDSEEVVEIKNYCTERDIKIEYHKRETLDSWLNSANHQGVLAVCEEYPYAELEEVLTAIETKEGNALMVILDHVVDPQNLGSLIRTCEASGVTGIVLPLDRAVGVTPAAVRASAGAAEHLLITRVPNLVSVMERLKALNVWMTGLEALPESKPYTAIDYTGKVCIIIGSEGHGLSSPVRGKCDNLASLPMFGKVSSLNAGVAGAIALYEVLRQQHA